MDRKSLTFEILKNRHRTIREGLPENISLRIHRALSWLHCAEQYENDLDAKFIFLWISFNAAYACEMPSRWETGERELLRNFLRIIIDSDKEKAVENLVWNEYANSIRLLINNRFLYQKFWDLQNGLVSSDEWETVFKESKSAATKALGYQDTTKVLSIVFERVYMLRNQLIHGGATWGGSVNREQIRDAAHLMGHIVPVLIHIMLNDKPTLIGAPCYPVVS
ncbi:MAG: hypothetical protein ACYYK0_01180 [Candidatus Eutrophobiaceae bacterium]